MILPRFEFLEPETFEGVAQIAEKHKGDALIMAGGTDLLVNLKRKIIKAKVVISLGKIPALKQIHYTEKDGLTLGAMVTINELAESPVIQKHFPLLSTAATKLGSPQIRNRATVGGNVYTARPAGDTIGPLLAYGAEVQLVKGKESRWEPLSKFINGPGKTTRANGEVLAVIKLKPLPAGTGVSYIKYGVRKAMEIAMVSITTAVTVKNGECKDARIILGAVGPTFIRSLSAEESLRGQKISDLIAGKACDLAANSCTPITDVRASAEYRSDLVQALTKRGIMEAAAQAIA